MNYIFIDGYNEIFRNSNGDQLEQKRLNYINDICGRYQNFSGSVFIIFDGLLGNSSQKNPSKNVRVYYSSNPQEADDYLRDLIVKHQNDSVEIITRDNEILSFAKSYNCSTKPHSSYSNSKKKSKKKFTERSQSLEDHENILFNLALKMRDDSSEKN